MKRHINQTPLTHHILSTSANLLGICFFVLSYIKMGEKADATLLDECIIVPIILFFTASVFSYLSMRSSNDEPRFEKMADLFFMTGLLSLSIIAVILIFKFI
ncbi:MAG: hypothetical protein H7336_02025 [Bacteriovorax sp.]|nr:hypothetical protein [Bacteriovorax sp.]